MIYKGSKKITKIFKGSTPVTKVYRGAVLVWQAITLIVYDLLDYKNRVEADYGQVEDFTQLQVEVDGGSQEYNDAIAIYNPNGGYRTGKIYNVRNLDGAEPTYDLEVTGGGGTRINADGLVEKIQYYNKLRNSGDVSASGWGSTGTVSQNGDISTLTEGSNQVHFVVQTGLTPSGIRTAEFKRGEGVRYIIFGATHWGWSDQPNFGKYKTGNYIIDLDELTVLKSGQNGEILSIEDVGDNWIRVAFLLISSSADFDRYVIGISNGPNENDMDYTGSGRSLRFRKPMFVENAIEDNLYYELNLDSPAFPKIDYSTGKPAFLIEPQRTNYIPNNSSTIPPDSISRYINNAIVTSGTSISPDNNQNADTLELTSTSPSYLREFIGLSAGVYTFSYYVKLGTASAHDSGVYSYTDDNWIISPIKIVEANSNSWTRVEITFTLDYDTTVYLYYGRYVSGSVSASENIGTHLIWGAQVEKGSNSTSLIPTNGSAVTRIKNYYEYFSGLGLYNKGWIYAELELLDDTKNSSVLGIATSNKISERPRSSFSVDWNSSEGEWEWYTRPSNTETQVIPTGISSKIVKVAFGVAKDGSRGHVLLINGVQITSVDNGPNSEVDQYLDWLQIGFSSDNGSKIKYSHLRLLDLQLLPEILTEADMQIKTTL